MVVRFPGRPQSQFNLMFLNIKNSSRRKRESLCESACLFVCGLFSSRRIPSQLDSGGAFCAFWVSNHWKSLSILNFLVKKRKGHLQMLIIVSVWAVISGTESEMRGRRKTLLPSNSDSQLVLKIGGAVTRNCFFSSLDLSSVPCCPWVQGPRCPYSFTSLTAGAPVYLEKVAPGLHSLDYMTFLPPTPTIAHRTAYSPLPPSCAKGRQTTT